MMTLGLVLFIMSVVMIVGGAVAGSYGLYVLFAGGASGLFVFGLIAVLLGVVLAIIVFSNDLMKKNTAKKHNNRPENGTYAYNHK